MIIIPVSWVGKQRVRAMVPIAQGHRAGRRTKQASKTSFRGVEACVPYYGVLPSQALVPLGGGCLCLGSP